MEAVGGPPSSEQQLLTISEESKDSSAVQDSANSIGDSTQTDAHHEVPNNNESVSKLGGKYTNSQQNPEEKLCGWLTQRARGLGSIKPARPRWCVYGEEPCKLYLYRNPHDLLPVGEISLANASFYFDAANADRPGMFEIHNDGKEHLLDAGNRHNMMYWLQELQKRRREFNVQRTSLSKDRVGQWSAQRPSHLSGLAAPIEGDASQSRPVFDLGDDQNPIPTIRVSSADDVSSSNGSISSRPSTAWALNNLKTELQSVFTNFIGHKGSAKNLHTSPSQEGYIFYSNDSSESSLLDPATMQITPDNSQSKLSSSGSDQSQQGVCSIKQSSSNSKFYSDEVLEVEQIRSGNCAIGQTTQTVPNRGSFADDGIGSKQQGKIMSTLKRSFRLGKRQTSVPVPSSEVNVGESVCPRCQSAPQRTSSGKDVIDLEEELQANREIVSLLQKKLGALVKEMESRKQASKADESDMTEMLVDRDNQIVDLTYQLEKLREEKDLLAEKQRAQEAELMSAKDHLNMYQDMLVAKDEAVRQLTNQVFDYENKQVPPPSDTPDLLQQQYSRDSSMSTGSFGSSKPVMHTDSRELEKLKDMCQGYELQHKFLAKEILEMQELRKYDQAREKMLMINFAKMEAKYYQIKSKYFVLLQVAKRPVREGENDNSQELVKQLLEDALESEDAGDLELHLASSSGQEYDRYGFSRKYNFADEVENDDDMLSMKAAAMERQSQEITTKVKEANQEASCRVKWENFMVGLRGKTLQRSLELKQLVRLGIPHEYREEIWKGCINFYVGPTKDKLGPKFYSDLVSKLKSTSSTPDPSAKQIELDLLRTLPNNKHYETMESDGIPKLRRILLAYSQYNPRIGYCQGLNRVAAIALLFLSEEEAFWCVVAIVDHLLPQEYYSKTLMAAQVDQRVLKDLIQDKLPKVHTHFEQHQVDLSLFTFNWFLTIFIDNIPTETFLRIWDTFLYEGSKVLFRFAISFFKLAEDEILKKKDNMSLHKYLRVLGEKMTNIKQICQYSFYGINPFPMRFIATRRQQHLHEIKQELEELDALRSRWKQEQVSDMDSNHEGYDTDDDLDS